MRHALPLIAALSLLSCQVSVDRIAEAREVLDSAQYATAAQDATRTAALRAAVGDDAAAAVVGDGPCTVALDGELSLDDPRFNVLHVTALESSTGPRRRAFAEANRALLTEIMLLTEATREAGDGIVERARGAAESWPWDATLVTQELSLPRYTDQGIYFPGMITGTIFVWSYSEDRVACAAPIAVTNSPDVLDRIRLEAAEREAFERDPGAYLLADLRARASAAALAGLRRN